MVNGGLIDQWAMGERFWTLPQLILHFPSTRKEGFAMPKELGHQGRVHWLPSWVRAIFPQPFISEDPDKSRTIIDSVFVDQKNGK